MATPRKKPEDLKKAGRKTKFTEDMLREVTNYCLLGCDDEQLAKYLHISVATLNNWKSKYPLFLASVSAGKEKADAAVAGAMYHRALGYSHPEVHVTNYKGEIILTDLTKHYPPDTAAGKMWLTNRQRRNWQDRQEVTGADGSPLVPAGQEVNTTELARKVAFLLRKGVETKKKG